MAEIALILHKLAHRFLMVGLVATMTSAWADHDFTIRQWGVADGLPHGFVHDVVQTPDDYLWIATWEGLVRFNGHEFQLIRPSEPLADEPPGIWSLLVDSRGQLWAGRARGGVLQLAVDHLHLADQEGLPTAAVVMLADGGDDGIVVGLEGHGAYLLANGSATALALTEGDQQQTVYDVVRDGEAWLIGAERGLYRVNDGTVTGPMAGIPGPVRSVAGWANQGFAVGSEGGLYFGTYGAMSRHDGWGAHDASFIKRAGDDIWIGTLAMGLAKLGISGETTWLGADRLPHGRVTTVLEDAQNNLWVGTANGLAMLRPQLFQVFDRHAGIASTYVRSVLATPSHIWMGGARGVSALDRDSGEIRSYDASNGLGSDSVLSLAPTTNGEVWVGTLGAGIVRVGRDGPIETMGVAHGLPSNQIRALVTMGRQTWVGTISGAAQLIDDQLEAVYDSTDGLPAERILSFYFDRAGMLWVGTAGGLARFEGDRFVAEPALAGRDIMGIFQLPGDAALWLTTDSGLLRYDGNALQRINEDHGLVSGTVFAAQPDGFQQLWLTSNMGIQRVGVESIRTLLAGEADHVEAQLYTENDGLLNRQANGATFPSTAIDDTGGIWFSTAGGAVVVDPEQTSATAVQPRVQIESVTVDGVARARGEQIVVPAGARNVELGFAGLSFTRADDVVYQFRLYGQDDDWTRIAHPGRARYTNLPPGDYRFEVSATVDQVNWGQPASLQILAQPTWYERRDSQMLMVVAALLLVFLGWRGRTAHLRTRQHELQQEVSHQTRELQARARALELANAENTALVDRLKRLAREDGLTGLANRRTFDRALAKAFSKAKQQGTPLSVALLDLDYFKSINDHHSHQVGDEVLRRVAGTLAQAPGVQLAARYGGEEFALLYEGMNQSQAVAATEALRKAIASEDFADVATDLKVTTSAGVGSAQVTGAVDPDRLVAAVDAALYRAKAAGRNCSQAAR